VLVPEGCAGQPRQEVLVAEGCAEPPQQGGARPQKPCRETPNKEGLSPKKGVQSDPNGGCLPPKGVQRDPNKGSSSPKDMQSDPHEECSSPKGVHNKGCSSAKDEESDPNEECSSSTGARSDPVPEKDVQSDLNKGRSPPKGIQSDPNEECSQNDSRKCCRSAAGSTAKGPSPQSRRVSSCACQIARSTISSSGAPTVNVERPREIAHDVVCCRGDATTGCGTRTESFVEASPPDTSISCPSLSTPSPPDQKSTRGVVLRPGLETNSRGAGDPAACLECSRTNDD